MVNLKKSLLGILILIILAVAMYPLGNMIEDQFPPQKPQEIASMDLGNTVMAGTKVVDDYRVRKTSSIYHPDYLIDLIYEGKYLKFLTALTTGTVETPFQEITGKTISSQGTAQGFEGPGYLTVQDDKLVVSPPDTFLWGFITPYTIGVKTKTGLEIRENGETVKTVSVSDMSNSTIPHDYVSFKNFQKWYNKSDVGDNITLDYQISRFSDGRNPVSPPQIVTYFGAEVKDYMEQYPSGTPVLVYNGASSQQVVSSAVDTMGSYPEYDDNTRALNGKQFVSGWNGTIIPPHTASSGKDGITFYGVYDKNASGDGKGGYVSHGACPPGRSMRSAVMKIGLPLPRGMSGGFYSVAIESHPTTGIFVNNTSDFPVQIIMWTQGNGASMRIYTQVIQFLP